MKILLVEDEPKLARVLLEYLESAGFEARWVDNGLEVMPLVREWEPSLVLLDLMLPGRDGLDVCRDIRAHAPIPVIMITARTEEIDRLLGLELGADDYICKPYSPREVIARTRAVLRRTQAGHQARDIQASRVGMTAVSGQTGQGSQDDPVQQGGRQHGLHIDRDTWRASLDGAALDLTPAEFRLLDLMAGQPGRIFSRDQLLDGLYEDRRVVTDRTVDTHIKNIRRKFAAVRPGHELIRSVYGVGYSLQE